MKIKIIWSLLFTIILSTGQAYPLDHDINFCGEKIPVSNNFVANKLMNVIRQQIPNVNFLELRRSANKYFAVVEAYLRKTGLPEDFKYLALVESGFKNNVSPKGAAGFWQLMPGTAIENGLEVSAFNDERTDINKSTYAACRILAKYYNQIASTFKIYSWVLTAAAYNCGPGCMNKAIRNQGNDFFQMSLNDETANYVYKIIAVKELWEYPELYMDDFGYNLFSSKAAQSQINIPVNTNNDAAFSSMVVNVNEKSGNYPAQLTAKEISKDETIVKKARATEEQSTAVTFVQAKINQKYKEIKDGQLIFFTLLSDLQVGNNFTAKQNIIGGTAWIIDNRVFIDLGHGHNVVLYDQQDDQKGLSLSSLKNKMTVTLKVENN